jgi:hypothetical protein
MILTFALGSVLAAGCRDRTYREPPRPYPPSTGGYIPRQNIPIGPPPEGAPPLPSPPPTTRGSSPEPPAAELLLPEDPPKSKSEKPTPAKPDRGGAILGDPDYAEKPKADAKVEEEKPKNGPTGIAAFAEVKTGVTTGRRPEIEGLDWLHEQKYRTVIHLKKPGDDDTTDRRQVEKREMQYVALEVSPEKLTKEWLDDFNRRVADADTRPIFVYAGDPNAAYAVWYLHLRTVENLTHDEARLRAGRYGSKDENSAIFQAALKLVPAQ